MRLMYIPILIAANACSTASMVVENPKFTDINQHRIITTFTDKAGKKFELTVKNLQEKLCLSQGDWPNENGQLSSVSGYVFARIDGQKVELKRRNLGHCQGDYCNIELLEGQVAKASIPFSEFENDFSSIPTGTIELVYALPLSNDGCGVGNHLTFEQKIRSFDLND